jgi:hypothetical protein
MGPLLLQWNYERRQLGNETAAKVQDEIPVQILLGAAAALC